MPTDPTLQSAAQQMFDTGPNAWVPTGNSASGVLVQRGLSGNYAKSTSGVPEATATLSGEWSGQQYVSTVGDPANVPHMTSEVTSVYNDPLAVQARMPASALAAQDDTSALTSRAIQPNEITALGSFAPSSQDNAQMTRWARNYLDLQDQMGITPADGSRGQAFSGELRDAFATARYGESDGFGRPLLNGAERDQAVADVVKMYSEGGSNPPPAARPSAEPGCGTCNAKARARGAKPLAEEPAAGAGGALLRRAPGVLGILGLPLLYLEFLQWGHNPANPYRDRTGEPPPEA